MTPALLLLLAVFALPMVQYAWLSTQAQTVLIQLDMDLVVNVIRETV